MNLKRQAALIIGIIMAGTLISGCGTSSERKRERHSRLSSDDNLNSKDKEDSDDDIEDISDKTGANFHIGADFNNLLNGGYITENENYVLYIDDYIYRYDKDSGENKILSYEDGYFLNVSKDGYLYLARNDGPSYGNNDSVYKINLETGEEELFIKLEDYLPDSYYFQSGISEVKIKYMILAENKLVIKADILCFHSENYCCFFSVDINDNNFSLLQDFSETGYGEGLYVDMCAFAAYDDKLVYAYKQGDFNPMVIASYDPFTNVTEVMPFETEGGSSLNDIRKSSVDGFDENGNFTHGLYDEYDLEFFDCSSDNCMLCFYDSHPYAYNYLKKTAYECDDVLHTIQDEDQSLTIVGKAFHDGKYYFLDYEKGIYWLSDDFSNGGILYVPDESNEYVYSTGHGGVQQCGFGYADECLWLIPIYGTDANVMKVDFDGKAEEIDISNAEEIINPNNNGCKGEIIGINNNGISFGDFIYESIDDETIKYLEPGTDLIVKAKIINCYDKYGDITENYYKVELEDGTVGFVPAKSVRTRKEPNDVIDYSNLSGNEKNGTALLEQDNDSKANEQQLTTEAQTSKITGTVITENDELNVRSGPSTEYDIIGTIEKGKNVTIISDEDNWYIIDFNGKTGYVSSEYISINN